MNPWPQRRGCFAIIAMTFFEFLILLVVAAICGMIAQSLAGYSHRGCLASIAIGFIGALLGAWLAKLSGLPDILSVTVGGRSFPIVWSIAGGALFAAVLGLLTRSTRRVD